MSDASDFLAAAFADRYRIIRKVGEGGMAVVYLAEDLRHDRKVALKLLRPEVAGAIGADRFLAEIRTAAHLQHPHILPLFDSGRADDGTGNNDELLFYVMPFVEGESLRQRLAREKQLPVAEAVRLAGEVADALDYAHRQGVLHRDIKPENILLHDGHALVADFGIALAVSKAEGAGRLTRTGIALGTPQYMSPEQAMGERNLDPRSDVYALGATLYEMLTGEPPHTGPSAQVIFARAATAKPRPVRQIRDAVPASLEAVVLTALRPLPADRFATAAEFARALRLPPSAVAPTEPWVTATTSRSSRWPQIAVAGLLVLVTAMATRWWTLQSTAKPSRVVPARVMLPLPAGQLLRQGILPFDISRDGSLIVYTADFAGTSRLYVRRLDDFREQALRGTEGAESPFFSPDGEWIGYFAAGKLWKVARAGGAPIRLADANSGRCAGSWGRDDVIYYAGQGCASGNLHRVPARGGDVTSMPVLHAPTAGGDSIEAETAARVVSWPSLLPDGKHVLLSTGRGIGVLELSTGRLRTLLRGWQPRYLATGHLLFESGEGSVRLVRFDVQGMEVTGEPIPAFETFRGPDDGGAFIAVSENGTVVYVAGGFDRSLLLTDRRGGSVVIADTEKRGYRFPRFSPDGRFIAVTVDPRPPDIWVVDSSRHQATRLTTDGGNIIPVWSPDGERIVFAGRGGLTWINRRGGDPQLFLHSRPVTPIFPSSWSKDGHILGFQGRGVYDLVSIAAGDSSPATLLATAADERLAAFSPDGQWIAYTSDRSGTNEVYVRPFPGPGASELVSLGGGHDPRWSRGGRELVYRRGSTIMAVEVRTLPTFQAMGTPRELFVAPYDFSQVNNWDVTHDGERFVFVGSDAASTRGFHVVINWFEELRARPNASASGQ